MNYSVLNSEFTTHKSQLINSKCAKCTILALASGKAERKTQNSKFNIAAVPQQFKTQNSKLKTLYTLTVAAMCGHGS